MAEKQAKKQQVTVVVPPRPEGGYRSIGRFFPNGPSTHEVTEEELQTLRNEPASLLQVLDESQLPTSSASDLTSDEKDVLRLYRDAMKRDPKGTAALLAGGGLTTALATAEPPPPSGQPTTAIEVGFPDVSRPAKSSDLTPEEFQKQQEAAGQPATGDTPPVRVEIVNEGKKKR
jgi:hypothetical protein